MPANIWRADQSANYWACLETHGALQVASWALIETRKGLREDESKWMLRITLVLLIIWIIVKLSNKYATFPTERSWAINRPTKLWSYTPPSISHVNLFWTYLWLMGVFIFFWISSLSNSQFFYDGISTSPRKYVFSTQKKAHSCHLLNPPSYSLVFLVMMCESSLREWKEVQISIWELKQNSKNGVLSSQVQYRFWSLSCHSNARNSLSWWHPDRPPTS